MKPVGGGLWLLLLLLLPLLPLLLLLPLLRTITYYNVLERIKFYDNVLQRTTTYYNILQCTTTHTHNVHIYCVLPGAKKPKKFSLQRERRREAH